MAVHLLADRLELTEPVGRMRWEEWGRAPEPESLEWWLATTSREAGRFDLPITFVAVDAGGDAVGAVGLAEFDIDDRADHRREGIGRALIERLEQSAVAQRRTTLWVATESAISFYEKCGYVAFERVSRIRRPPIDTLFKDLPTPM
jgi:GNAT superfamily N-acetyltransferase